MRLSIPFALSLALAAGCGDDSKQAIDAPKVPIDAAPVDLNSNEGGEIRLEWISQANAMGVVQTTARMGAYFYKSMQPAKFPNPAFPGCVEMRQRTKWPLAQGAIVPLDVGDVTLKPKTGTMYKMNKVDGTTCMPQPGCKTDPFQRPHDLWYQKPSALAMNDGDTFLPPNEAYDIELSGSADFPAVTLKDAAIMPDRWTPTSPDGVQPGVLTRDQPFTVTYTPGNTTAPMPPGVKVNTFMAFVGSPNIGPIVACQEEGTDGTIVVPAEFVNIILDHSGPVVAGEAGPGTMGRFVRQHLTHHIVELSNGEEVAPQDRKRLDIFSIYCFNNAWTAAP